MTPQEAKLKYEKEWPALNAAKEAAPDKETAKKCRQALNRLSDECRARFELLYLPLPAIFDKFRTAEGIERKFSPNGNGEHPDFTRESWREEVFNENTISGYWDWVHHEIIEADEERKVVYETNSL